MPVIWLGLVVFLAAPLASAKEPTGGRSGEMATLINELTRNAKGQLLGEATRTDLQVAEFRKGLKLCLEEPQNELVLQLAPMLAQLGPVERSASTEAAFEKFEQLYHQEIGNLLNDSSPPVDSRDIVSFMEIWHAGWHAMVVQTSDPTQGFAYRASMRRQMDRFAGREPKSSLFQKPGVLSGAEYQYGALLEQSDSQAAAAHWLRLSESPDQVLARLGATKLATTSLLQRHKSVPLDWTFTALDGKVIDTKAWQGKVILIDCWATWCVPCVAELPKVKRQYERWHASGLEVIGLACEMARVQANDPLAVRAEKLGTARQKLESFVRSHDLRWPQSYDGNGIDKAKELFGVSGIPQCFLFGRDGRLVAEGTVDSLEPIIEKLLGPIEKNDLPSFSEEQGAKTHYSS